MKDLTFSNTVMPVVSMCDLCAASEPFYHIDRAADFYVLIYVIEGAIYVTENDIDYEIKQGELLILRKGVHHFGKRECPKGTRWYYFHFDMKEITDNAEYAEFYPDSGALPQYCPLAYKIKLPQYSVNLRGSGIEKKLADIIEYSISDDRTKCWRMNSLLFDLLTEIAIGEDVEAGEKSLSARVKESLAKRVKEQFSAASLEQEFFLSYKYMSAVFKRDTGTTMQRYHNSLRMNEAARLLRSTLSPIGEIAQNLGFSDMLYFSRCFHSFFGVSPTEYRRSLPVFQKTAH